jgi:hypothetical protein
MSDRSQIMQRLRSLLLNVKGKKLLTFGNSDNNEILEILCELLLLSWCRGFDEFSN